MFNNITKKLSIFLFSTLLLIGMFGSKAFAEDQYVIKTITIKTALATYNIEITQFHLGSVVQKINKNGIIIYM